MAYIATGSTTVGEVIDYQIDFLLGGLFREKKEGKGTRQVDLKVNAAQRHAIEVIRQHLHEVWCGDGQTRFCDVAVPDSEIWGKPDA